MVSGLAGRAEPDTFEESAALWRDAFELEAPAVARLKLSAWFHLLQHQSTSELPHSLKKKIQKKQQEEKKKSHFHQTQKAHSCSSGQ